LTVDLVTAKAGGSPGQLERKSGSSTNISSGLSYFTCRVIFVTTGISGPFLTDLEAGGHRAGASPGASNKLFNEISMSDLTWLLLLLQAMATSRRQKAPTQFRGMVRHYKN
jgi:hypothetical protein